MSGKGKVCIVAVWAFLALLASSQARYTDSAEDVEKSVADVDDVASLDGSDQDAQQFFDKDLVPVTWDSGLPFDLRRALLEDASEDYLPEYAIGPAYKRQISNEYRKRSRLNQLVRQLLSMQGTRYHYHRVAPMRFGGGRR